MTKSAKESVLGLLFLMGVGTVVGIAGTVDRDDEETTYTRTATVFEVDGNLVSFMDNKGNIYEADNAYYPTGTEVTLVIDDKGTVVFVEGR